MSWIFAQAGAGKTALVASYLEVRSIPTIWFQLDRGDADPATFFYYLKLACEHARLKQRSASTHLPLLTQEYQSDIPLYARRFFRALFARMGSGTLIVFDNFQEVDSAAPLHKCLTEGFAEIPHGVHVIIISRFAPFSEYVRFVANRNASVLEWEDLRLDQQETIKIAQQHLRLSPTTLEKLHTYCDVWAAGLTLILEYLRHHPNARAIDEQEGLTGVFEYFAGLVLAQIPDEHQHTLRVASFLPSIVADVLNELSGRPDAEQLLHDLYERRLFTDRRKILTATNRAEQRPSYVYHFHALFRTYLSHTVADQLPKNTRMQLAKRAGDLLAARGDLEDAIDLYFQAQQWDSARAIIRQIAEHLIEQGRWQIVLAWIEAFPDAIVTTDAWLLYFKGTALITSNVAKGREVLENAYEIAQRDELKSECTLLAAAAIMQSYFFDYRDMTPLKHWIGVMEGLLGAAAARSHEIKVEVRATQAMLFALAYYDPSHPMMAGIVECAFELAPQVQDTNLRMQLYTQLGMYGGQLGHVPTLARVIPTIEKLLETPGVTALNRIMGCRSIAWACHTLGDFSRGILAAETAIKIAEEQGIPYAAKVPTGLALLLELMRGNFERGRVLLDRLETLVDSRHVWDRALLLGMHTYYGIFVNDASYAQRFADSAVKEVDKCGVALYRILYRHILSWTLIEHGQYEVATQRLLEAESLCVGSKIAWPLAWVYLHKAEIARRVGNSKRFDSHLELALTQAQNTGCGPWLSVWGSWMPRLCERALRIGACTAYVRTLIRTHRWQPENAAADAWPWPIKVFVLGHFELWINDELIQFQRKAPKKPLALLKALVSLGCAGVSQEELCDTCWPDLDGDSAAHTLTVTLLRLRELLGHREAVLVQDGALSLNPGLCWTDAKAFEQLSEKIVSAGTALTVEQLLDLAERIRRLYRGALLQSEGDPSWLVAPRERIRLRFLSIVSTIAVRCEQAQAWGLAMQWYGYGQEIDPLAEALYQGAMRCSLASGHYVDGLNAYERLCKVLALGLASKPSAGTETLRQMLSANSATHQE